MKVKIRFFAQFKELFGTDCIVDARSGTTLLGLISDVASKNPKGSHAIFDEQGALREFVILMRNGKRVELADAATTAVVDGDEIAVFPPVAGG